MDRETRRRSVWIGDSKFNRFWDFYVVVALDGLRLRLGAGSEPALSEHGEFAVNPLMSNEQTDLGVIHGHLERRFPIYL